MLTSCAQAPSEVNKEIEDYNSAQTVQETDTDTLPVNEALEQARSFNSANKTNIKIQNLILPDSTKMPTYNVRFDNSGVADLFTKLQSEPLFANKGGGTTVDTPNDFTTWKNKKNYCFTAFPETNGVNYYHSESDVKQADWGTYYGQAMRMTEVGSITLYAGEEKTGIGASMKYSVEKRFFNNFSQNTESYTLCDGKKMSVNEAAVFSEKFCNDTLTSGEKKLFDYQVNYVDVRKVSPDKYGYRVSLCRKDKYGNLFDATKAYECFYDHFESRNALIASPMFLWITSADNIAEFEKNYTFSIDETGSNDKIITLKTAVNTLSNKLAQGKSYDFDTAELKYIFEVTQSDYIDAARKYQNSPEFDSNSFGVVYSPRIHLCLRQL